MNGLIGVRPVPLGVGSEEEVGNGAEEHACSYIIVFLKEPNRMLLMHLTF